MMRMVIAHEVGHALGLPHNMGASCAYEIESYRDGAFTQKKRNCSQYNGLCEIQLYSPAW
jgi:predicted Zn-dependent protease